MESFLNRSQESQRQVLRLSTRRSSDGGLTNNEMIGRGINEYIDANGNKRHGDYIIKEYEEGKAREKMERK